MDRDNCRVRGVARHVANRLPDVRALFHADREHLDRAHFHGHICRQGLRGSSILCLVAPEKRMKVRPRLSFDIECYTDWWCICFNEIDGDRKKHFELYEGHPLDRMAITNIINRFTLVGFNSTLYDIPMLRLAMRVGVDNRTLKKMSDDIVVRQQKPWHLEDRYQLPKLKNLDHFDLIEPAPSVMVGLKLYGGRLHSRKLQDLPIEPSALIFDHGPELRQTMIDYCYNDTQVAIDLYRHIKPQIILREQMSELYGIDLRSKSDAQIAEAVIRSELERQRGEKIYRPELPHDYSFQYQPPAFLKFKTNVMQEAFETVLNATFKLKKKAVKDDEDGVEVGGIKVKISGVEMPPEIKSLRIAIGDSRYKMGIGGLHSTESKVASFTDDKFIVRDADVASYYPSLMLECGIYPDHLGPAFIEIYRGIRDSRVEAKHKAAALKKEIAKVEARIKELENGK